MRIRTPLFAIQPYNQRYSRDVASLELQHPIETSIDLRRDVRSRMLCEFCEPGQLFIDDEVQCDIGSPCGKKS